MARYRSNNPLLQPGTAYPPVEGAESKKSNAISIGDIFSTQPASIRPSTTTPTTLNCCARARTLPPVDFSTPNPTDQALDHSDKAFFPSPDHSRKKKSALSRGWKAVRDTLFPRTQNRRYARWIKKCDTLGRSDRLAIKKHIARLSYHPKISVVMAAYRPTRNGSVRRSLRYATTL